jgi:hypothetical protein
MNLRRILLLAVPLATGMAGESWAASASGGGLLALLKMALAVLCLLFLISLPWLFLRFMERRSGDPLWLYHKVFKDDGA